MSNDDERVVTIEEQINNLQLQMLIYDGYADEYTKMVKNLSDLYRIKSEKDKLDVNSRFESEKLTQDRELRVLELEMDLATLNAKSGVDVNTVITAITNLVGIFTIVSFEKANVLATKALGFVRKV